MSASQRGYNILVVDDEQAVLKSICDSLKIDERLSIDTVLNGREALKLVSKCPRKYAVILVDYLMPEMNGAELTKELLKINEDLVIAMLSGDTSRDALKQSLLSGAVDFLEKGLPVQEFRNKVLSFCKKYEAFFESCEEDELKTSDEELIISTGMIGKSKSLAHLSSLIHRAANVTSNVLIYGESGTGKELVAKAVHNLSKRKNYNFVAVNMGAISPNLFESEMFGHIKGSYTGAMNDRIGYFKKANLGTIFLDEIGDMPLDQQVKLLRVLQEKEILPVGSNKVEKIDARVIAASNVDLEKAKNLGRFREDLFFRLSVFPLFVPALRDRPEDIKPLVLHFRKKYNGMKKVIFMEVIHKMAQYKWPGNIRELESEVQKLIEVIPDEKITLKHLDGKFFDESNFNSNEVSKLSYEEFKKYLKAQEADYLVNHIKKFKSLREAANEGLKIPLSTLQGKMEALNINLKGKAQ